MRNSPSLIPTPDLALASTIPAKWLTMLPDPGLPVTELSKGVYLHSTRLKQLQESVISHHPHHSLGPWDQLPKLLGFLWVQGTQSI